MQAPSLNNAISKTFHHMIMLHELWIWKHKSAHSVHINKDDKLHPDPPGGLPLCRERLGGDREREREMSVSIWQGREKDMSVISLLTDTLAECERAKREKEWDRGTNIAGVSSEKSQAQFPSIHLLPNINLITVGSVTTATKVRCHMVLGVQPPAWKQSTLMPNYCWEWKSIEQAAEWLYEKKIKLLTKGRVTKIKKKQNWYWIINRDLLGHNTQFWFPPESVQQQLSIWENFLIPALTYTIYINTVSIYNDYSISN